MNDSLFQKILKPFVLLVTTSTMTACIMQQPMLRDPTFIPPTPVAPVAPRQAATGSIYNSATSRFLFEDYRARRVGDILTILLEEKTAANKKANTSTKKKGSLAVSVPQLFGRGVTLNGKPVFDSSFGSDVGFSGAGDSSQSNSLRGNVTVAVTQVLSNGNLVVRGEKLLSLNQGSEVVRISGIVRPVDISPQNTIASHQVANAQITYKGKGMVANSNDAGWFTRFMNTKWWPF